MIKEKKQNIFNELKADFGYKNVMQAPWLEKVVVSVGTGSINDKNKIEVVEDRLQKITGQKPAPRSAKKSIAAFKTREGDTVGYQVTLRGKRMYDFLDKLIDVALPRTKDFRGLSYRSLDEMGNCTFGLTEHTIFPETSDEELKNVFGMSVTVVSSAQSKEEAKALFDNLGFPFKPEV